MSRKIENIRTKTHALGLVPKKPRVAYDNVQYLNPSSIAAGLVDHTEIDGTAIKDEFEREDDRKRSQAQQDLLDKGTLGHMLILEPHRVATDVAVWKGKIRSGNEWDAFEAEHSSRLIIRKADFEAVSAICNQYRFNSDIQRIITEVDIEAAIFSREDDIYVKGLMDAITKGNACNIIDPKFTSAGLGYHSTNKTLRDFNNREKMAAYKRWVEQETDREVIGCYNIFLSLDEPRIRIKKMSTMALEWGEKRILDAIDEVRKCLDSGNWPMFVKEDIVLVEEWERRESEVEVTFGGQKL